MVAKKLTGLGQVRFRRVQCSLVIRGTGIKRDRRLQRIVVGTAEVVQRICDFTRKPVAELRPGHRQRGAQGDVVRQRLHSRDGYPAGLDDVADLQPVPDQFAPRIRIIR